MFSVDMLLVTMFAASNGGMLLNPPARPCPICLVTFTPCAHATLSYDTLTGTDRFTSQRAKYPEAWALAYADDGYIKANMSVALQVLAELKHVLKVEDGLDLNGSKTSVLPKGVTQTSPLR